MSADLSKLLLVLLSLKALCCGAVGPATEPTSFGEWSEPSEGVRGRLAFAEGPSRLATRTGILYLEIQNLSRSEPVSLHYRAAESPLRCELRDAEGKPVQAKGVSYSGWIPEPCWLVLPHDSSLRFRVTLSGFGVPPNTGWLIAGGINDCWSLPPEASGDYFLSGTLAISPPPEEVLPRGAWKGVLKLPPLRVSLIASAGSVRASEGAPPAGRYSLSVGRVSESEPRELEWVFILGGTSEHRGGETVCKSVASLKTLLNGLPTGSSVDWRPTCEAEVQALEGHLDELKNACLKAGITLTIHPTG